MINHNLAPDCINQNALSKIREFQTKPAHLIEVIRGVKDFCSNQQIHINVIMLYEKYKINAFELVIGGPIYAGIVDGFLQECQKEECAWEVLKIFFLSKKLDSFVLKDIGETSVSNIRRLLPNSDMANYTEFVEFFNKCVHAKPKILEIFLSSERVMLRYFKLFHGGNNPLIITQKLRENFKPESSVTKCEKPNQPSIVNDSAALSYQV